MKRKITFLLAALLLLSGLSWAQQITWTAADQGYGNGDVIESVDFNDYVAGEFFQGTNNNAPKYYNTGAAIRCYGGNYFTITSDYVLTEIALGFGSGDGSNAITSNVGTYENGTWTGSANEVTFTIGGTSGHRRIASFTITYDEGGNPAPSITASNVEIAYDATEGAIAYTINDGVDGGVLTAATEAEWLTIGTVGETVPFTCTVNDDGERVATVTLTYTYDTDQTVTKNVTVTQANNPNAPGTENNPYTVAQARAAIDAGTGTQGVYATGIVSGIVNEWNTQYNNISFNISDDGLTTSDQLQAFRCVSTTNANASEVAAGDVVIVYGNLTLYNNSVYEFTAGCQLVSLEHPVITDPYITAENVSIEFDATAGSIAYEIENPTNDGVLTASVPEGSWITLGDDFTSPIAFTCSVNQTSSPRTATVTLTYTYGDSQTAIKDVTVTQDGNPNAFNNISDITEVGANYHVKGMVVATSNKGFIICDGTGFVYTYLNATPTQQVGDYVQITGTTGSYGHVIQFTNTATIAEAEQFDFEWPDYTVLTEVPDYTESYHLSDCFQFAGTLTKSGNNYFVAVGEGQIRISYPTEEQATDLEALLNKTVRIHGFFTGYSGNGNNAVFTAMMESYEEVVVPTLAVTPDMVTVPYTGGRGDFTVTPNNVNNAFGGYVRFYDPANPANELEVDPDWIFISYDYSDFSLSYSITEANNSNEPRTACFKFVVMCDGGLALSNLITVTQDAAPQPSITLNNYTITVPAAGEDAVLTVQYENIDEIIADVELYDADGNAVQASYYDDWFTASLDNDNNVHYLVMDNDGAARTAYFKVYAMVGEGFVYSDLVTINQAEYVVDYAELPFEWDTFGTTPAGITNNGVSTGSNNAYLKFDNTDDNIILKINERPGTLSFNIKANPGSNGWQGTFKVQTSVDGENYEDLKTYDALSTNEYEPEEFPTLSEDVRYIKWIYTEKVSGNVALDDIALAEYVEPIIVPSIILPTYSFEATAAESNK